MSIGSRLTRCPAICWRYSISISNGSNCLPFKDSGFHSISNTDPAWEPTHHRPLDVHIHRIHPRQCIQCIKLHNVHTSSTIVSRTRDENRVCSWQKQHLPALAWCLKCQCICMGGNRRNASPIVHRRHVQIMKAWKQGTAFHSRSLSDTWVISQAKYNEI